MISPSRALRLLRARKAFSRLGADPIHFEFWCAAKDIDPRGLLGSLPRPMPTWERPEPPDHGSGASARPALVYGDPRGLGWTPLHEACHLGSRSCAAGLLAGRPESLHDRDWSDCAALRAIFLFNDTSPGWKHGGPFFEGEGPEGLRAPIGADKELALLVRMLLAKGAKLRGGELCSAAYLGLSACVDELLAIPHAHADAPDAHFPDWALGRGFIQQAMSCSKKKDSISPALACALDGDRPACGLQIALASPRRWDAAHAKAICEAGLHGLAMEFLRERPSAAQAMLMALFCSTRLESKDAPAGAIAALARACMALGADPHQASALDSPDMLSPFEMASLNARVDLISACDQVEPLSCAMLEVAMSLIRKSPKACADRLAQAAALVEARIVEGHLGAHAKSSPKPRGNRL